MVFLDFQGLEVATAFRGWPVATRKCLFIYRSRESLKKKVSCHRASHFKLWLLTKRTGWWLQSIWKICSSNWIISPCRGENKKYLKPPLRKSIMSESFIAPSFKSNRIHLKNPNTLPETNSSPPQNRPLEFRRFLLETTIFRGYASFREGRRCLGPPKSCRKTPKVGGYDVNKTHQYFEVQNT